MGDRDSRQARSDSSGADSSGAASPAAPSPGAASSAAQRRRRPQKTAERAARQIVGDIVAQDLAPGDRLPAVPAMAERYGVGYASVREALRTLESSGLIYVKPGPGGGPVVADRGGAEFSRVIRLYCQVMGVTFRHVVHARQALEPLLAREVAQTVTPELREQLLLAAKTGGCGQEDFGSHAREFHDLLASHSHADINPVLRLFAQSIGQIYQEFVRTRGPRGERGDQREVEQEHRRIAEAIAAGDGSRAERLMERHMADLVDYVATQYELALDDVIEWT